MNGDVCLLCVLRRLPLVDIVELLWRVYRKATFENYGQQRDSARTLHAQISGHLIIRVHDLE